MSEPAPIGRLLVVEDKDSLRTGIVRAVEDRFATVDAEANGSTALERIRDPGLEAYDVVLTDLRLPGADGMEVLRAALASEPAPAVVMMTAHGTIETAVEAMQLGATDFVQKPFELDELEARLHKALGHARLKREVADLRHERAVRLGAGPIVGHSPGLRAAVGLAERVATSRSTVLVTGETGTGKELIAGLIHSGSPRSGGPFVKVNCAALPETLLESELFGHERGAFTSADRLRIGRFEQADGGTLFLDEIGDMTPATQAKLLRVLQDGEFQRLGGTRVLRSDVRVVAATNQDLPRAIDRGHFREDLYFRLAVIAIELPPLRDRPEDVEELAVHFLTEVARELGRPFRGLTPDAVARVRAHPWPGNVRELRNAMERAALMSDGPRIEASALSLVTDLVGGGGWRPELPTSGLALEEIERAVVLETLERTGFVQKDAAVRLGVSRRKLNYMVRKLGITHPSWRRNRSG